MDYTYRERQGEALYWFKDSMLPSDFFRRNVVLSFQEDAIGISRTPPFPAPIAGEARVRVSTT